MCIRDSAADLELDRRVGSARVDVDGAQAGHHHVEPVGTQDHGHEVAVDQRGEHVARLVGADLQRLWGRGRTGTAGQQRHGEHPAQGGHGLASQGKGMWSAGTASGQLKNTWPSLPGTGLPVSSSTEGSGPSMSPKLSRSNTSTADLISLVRWSAVTSISASGEAPSMKTLLTAHSGEYAFSSARSGCLQGKPAKVLLVSLASPSLVM